MALSRSKLTQKEVGYSGFFGATAETITTSSFAPSDNSLLVVVFVATNGTVNKDNVSISDSAGLAWTKRVAYQSPSDDAYWTTYIGEGVQNRDYYWESLSVIWTAPVTTGQSMTITVSSTEAALSEAERDALDLAGIGVGGYDYGRGQIFVYQYTGHNQSSPVGGTGGAEYASTADTQSSLTFEMSSEPTYSSEIIAVVCAPYSSGGSDYSNPTPSGLFSEIDEFEYYDVPPDEDLGVASVAAKSSSISTAVGFTFAFATPGASISAAAIEIKVYVPPTVRGLLVGGG